MSSDPAAIAAHLPNYQVERELGRGGFGIVYAGRHLRLDRPVAIKELPTWLVDNPTSRRRFLAEARVLASLDHPHIVPVYDYVEAEARCLLVMEYLGGGTVWEWFQKTGIGAEQACAVAAVTAAALQDAHEHGVLHRDVKPENLLLSDTRHLKLTDFGIAAVVGGNETLVTSEGVLGTPAYMAPEQAEGTELTPAVDVYAAGVMLYEMLSGQLPFSEEGGGLAILYRHVNQDPVSLGSVAPSVPAPVSEVVMQALERQPSRRYPSAEDFGVALGRAATASFGEGWFSRTGVPVISPGRIRESLDAPPDPSVWIQQSAPGSRQTQTSPQAETPEGEQASAPPETVIRPQVADHVAGEGTVPAEEPPVPVRQVLDLPRFPWVPSLVASVAIVVLLLASFLGWGSSSPSGGSLPPAASVAVAGHDVTHGGTVKLDVGKDFPVAVRGVPEAQAAQLKLSVLGAQLASGSSSLTPAFGGLVGTLHLTSALASPKYVVPGPVEATLGLSGANGTAIGNQHFTMSPTGIGFLTVPGIVVIALILFVGAYLESLLRPIRRRGKWTVGTVIGLGVIGALAGVTLVGLSWVLGSAIPSGVSLVLCGVLGALGAVALGLAVARSGLRARVRRIARKQGIVASGRMPVEALAR
jgi:serine/threonine-protein kinase